VLTFLFPVFTDISRATFWTLHRFSPDFIAPLCNAEELLCQKPRPGRPRIMNPEIVEKLSEELNQVEGFSSYKEVHQWLTSCCDIPVAYRTVHQWVRYRLKGKLKVPRPVSEKQKPGAVEEFKKNCQF